VSSREITIIGYLVLLCGGLAIEVLARRTRTRVPPLGDVLTRAMRTRTGRVGVRVAWAWLGLHFFAR
jgi:Family of unknown function (DUF6186)